MKPSPPAPAPEPGSFAAGLQQLRDKAEEDLRTIQTFLQVTGFIGGILICVGLLIVLGHGIQVLLGAVRQPPDWILGLLTTAAVIYGLVKGAQYGESIPRRTAENAYDRAAELLRRPQLPLLAVADDLPRLLAGLTDSEDWRRLTLLDHSVSLRAQLRQAADFFPCLEAIVAGRPRNVLRWRFVLCALSRWLDDVTAFISNYFCCACFVPWGAILIVLPGLPLLILPILVTLRRRAALIALCDFFGPGLRKSSQALYWDEKK